MTDTLRSICEQCPHLNNPQLDFLSEGFSRHKEIILRDLVELVSAASAELAKTVIILSGSLLEAVLYSFIQCQTDFISKFIGEEFKFNPDHSLENYVRTFNKYFGGILPNAVVPIRVVGYRDLVHINRELNSLTDVCAQASRDMLRILNVLLGELSQFANPQP